MKPLEQVRSDSLSHETTNVEDPDINKNDQNESQGLDAVNIDMPDALDDDSDEEETPITQDHINHLRICHALTSVCADALREILLSQVPTGYHDIYHAINAGKRRLTQMRQLRPDQLDLIFPDPHSRYTGTVDQFDITLLYTLIRNISSVRPPVTGWNRPPGDNPRDTTLGANVERIKFCRNRIMGHSADGKLDDQCFEAYWKEIGEMLDDIESAIGDQGFKGALERRKKQAITPKEHLRKKQLKTHLQSQLQESRKTMQTLDETMQTLDETFKKLQTDLDTKL